VTTLAAEVALKLQLRTGAAEFADLSAAWMCTPLAALDLPALEEAVARCGRAVWAAVGC
jgi:hypothetical protein